MGLAGPKNRTKLSKDPNNTNWSNETDRFGHKILSGLGWTPGSTLGAKGAKHSSHYTDASASHIRVLLKDDNLGLGAKRGKADDQFGLAIFQNLLGRLNGKSDVDIQKDDEKRRDIELRQYQTQRFGGMHFVSGGFLVGDRIEQLMILPSVKAEADGGVKIEIKQEDTEGESRIEIEIKKEDDGKPKKRKRSARADDDTAVKKEDTTNELPAKKRSKKSKDVAIKSEPDEDDSKAALISTKAQAKLEKEERKQAKAERRARKEARRLKKEERRKAKEARKAGKSSRSDSSSSSDEDEEDTSRATSGTATPATVANGRNIVRQRYIQQKRMAWASEQALKEIFMIKTPG